MTTAASTSTLERYKSRDRTPVPPSAHRPPLVLILDGWHRKWRERSQLTDVIQPGGEDQTATGSRQSDDAPDRGNVALLSDDLAYKLAYECGWKLCENSIRTLEAQRTRAVALLSVALVAAGIVAAAFLAEGIAEELSCVGVLGGFLFAASALVMTVSTAKVAWPTMSKGALRPEKIIKNLVDGQHPDRSPAWVYKSLAGNLDTAYNELRSTLQNRNRFYKWSVGCAPAVLLGAGMVVLDVLF